MNRESFALLCLLMALCIGCTGADYGLQNGDLVFVYSDSDAMSSAISAVTSSNSEISYDHVGIVAKDSSGIFVLEAKPSQGVCSTPWDKFVENAPIIDSLGGRGICLFRIRPEVARKTGFDPSAAVLNARQYLQRPYDWAFETSDDAIYCSELVWISFQDREGVPLFPTVPMNFKNPDGSFPEFWLDLFTSLEKPIPQGQSGTNPNDLAKSNLLMPVPIHVRYKAAF